MKKCLVSPPIKASIALEAYKYFLFLPIGILYFTRISGNYAPFLLGSPFVCYTLWLPFYLIFICWTPVLHPLQYTEEWTDRQTYGRTDGRTNRRTKEWMNGRNVIIYIAHFIKPYRDQVHCKLDFGKVLWNKLYLDEEKKGFCWIIWDQRKLRA